MAEREHILIALVKDVLGPRYGSAEVLPEDQNPRDEYITGVLAPAKAPPDQENIDGEVDDFGEDVDLKAVDETPIVKFINKVLPSR